MGFWHGMISWTYANSIHPSLQVTNATEWLQNFIT